MCKLCEKNPVYEFTNQRKLCKTCFIHWFEKRVLYTIRKFGMIQRGDIIGYNIQGCIPKGHENLFEAPKNIQKNIFTKGNFRSVVLEEVLKFFSRKAGNEIVSNKKRHDKFATTNNLDIESLGIIQEIIKGKLDLKKHSPIVGKEIKPLYLFLDKEILLYAGLKKLKIKKETFEGDKISEFVEKMDKKHPELYHSIVNSYLQLTS